MIALDPSDEEAIWHLIRADYPLDAFVHVRDHHDERPEVRANVTRIRRLIGDNSARAAAFAVARAEKS